MSVEFEPQRWLNPALLKNQFPALLRLALTADKPMHNVGVTITCDAGVGRSTVSLTQDLVRGLQPIDVTDLHFPVLYQLIDQRTGRRWVNFTVRCWHGEAVLSETTRSVLWMGIAEWLDRQDMWHFIPAFVDPNTEGVLEVLDDADGVLKTVNPTSSFDGYQRADQKAVYNQAQAIFNCLREKHQLSYINVPPLEVFLPGDAMPSGQSVRSPTEVIEHRRGTCHDLAILFASCFEHIGIDPVIMLMPGHTYVAYWTSSSAWSAFWQQAQQDSIRLPQLKGGNWIIASADEMTGLVEDGRIVLLEATHVTDRNGTFDDALALGRANFGPGKGFDVAVDVVASRGYVQPV